MRKQKCFRILSPRLRAEVTFRETMFTLNNIHDVLCHSLFDDALFFFGRFRFPGFRSSFMRFSFSIYPLAAREIYGKRYETKKEVKIHLRHPECPNVGALKGKTTPCLARFELSLNLSK